MRFAMKSLKYLAAAAVLAAPMALSAAAQAAVEVTYVNPERFVDASPRGIRGAKADERVLVELRGFLEKQGERALKPGQDLQLDILDVDLAGRVEFGAHDIRVVREIDWPSIKLRYTLSENGAVVASGEERVSDLDYLRGINVASGGNDALKYEKSMLRTWLKKRFGGN
jgi:hypothetical protein